MKFDAYAFLENLRASEQGDANRAKRANPSGPNSTNSTISTPSAFMSDDACAQSVAPLPSAPPPSMPNSDCLFHGIVGNSYRRTWTGKVVSLDDWRQMTDWDQHGSTGKLWNGITRQWETDSDADQQ